MARKDISKILAVDDNPDAFRSTLKLGLAGKARGEVLHPQELELRHLEEADLVLVDWKLEDWPERSKVGLALQPVSGLALAVLLREHVDHSKRDRLTAFALYSGHLDEVRGRLPAKSTEHIIARLNNLEWAFQKENGSHWTQMVVLADAVRRMPRKWPRHDSTRSESKVRRLLALNVKTTWFDRAWRDVRKCQPPIHDLSDGEHSILFVRWLLHQVLPYPTFLWQEEWVAARLRLSVNCLRRIATEKGSQLSKDLETLTYRGVLCEFLGKRWWRGGLEQYIWEITDGKAVDVASLHKALRDRTKVKLDPLPSAASIVCLNSDLVPTGEFIEPDKGLRICPDQWPAFADEAWTSMALAKEDPRLISIVDPIDSAILGEEGGD